MSFRYGVDLRNKGGIWPTVFVVFGIIPSTQDVISSLRFAYPNVSFL